MAFMFRENYWQVHFEAKINRANKYRSGFKIGI